MTLDMTSMSVDAAHTGTLRSKATVLTAAYVTTVTTTEWLRSSRALESSAGRSVARHYRAHSNP
jgi:hypothetical protein